jgi:formate dehydrogenase major subunit
LRGQNYVQGAAHMGWEPEHLSGYATFEAGRDVVERIWNARLPEAHGLNLSGMMDAAERGELRALCLSGTTSCLRIRTLPRLRGCSRGLNC